MNWTFLLVFGFLRERLLSVVTCSSSSESDRITSRILSLKASSSCAMNHVNVILQIIYTMAPLRRELYKEASLGDGADVIGPLRLVMAKMFHDLGNEREATDPFVYLKDSYFKDREGLDSFESDPFEFYSFLTSALFMHKEYRELLQWSWRKLTLGRERGFEALIEEQQNVLRIDSGIESVQTFLADYFAERQETVSVGLAHTISRTVSRELLHTPLIATFTLSSTRSETFVVEPTISIGHRTFNLKAAVIINNLLHDRFETVLAVHNSPDWIRIQNENYHVIESFAEALELISRSGHLLFYVDSSAEKLVSPRPSNALIMKALKRVILNGLTLTVQKSNSHLALSARSPLASSVNTPIKSKASSTYHGAAPGLARQFSDTSVQENFSLPPESIARSVSLASLPALPSKSPPPEDLAHLKSILIPKGRLGNVRKHFSKKPVRTHLDDHGVRQHHHEVDHEALESSREILEPKASANEPLIHRVYSRLRSPDREMTFNEEEDEESYVHRNSFWESLQLKQRDVSRDETEEKLSLDDLDSSFFYPSETRGIANMNFEEDEDDLLISQISSSKVKKFHIPPQVLKRRRQRQFPLVSKSLNHLSAYESGQFHFELPIRAESKSDSGDKDQEDGTQFTKDIEDF